MNSICFSGVVVDGLGRHVELYVPGRDETSQGPSDWPAVLRKGSLNVRVCPDGYPQLFTVLGLPNRVRSLEVKAFAATFEIAQAQFGINMLKPDPRVPHKGSAQVWRATLAPWRVSIFSRKAIGLSTLDKGTVSAVA
jgi:hypothetical protein